MGELYIFTREDVLLRKELSFLHFIRKDNSIWFGGEINPSKGFSSAFN